MFRLLFISFILLVEISLAQQLQIEKTQVPLRAVGFPRVEIEIAIKNNMPYLNINEIFEIIGVYSIINFERLLISGFFRSQDFTYHIDMKNWASAYNGIEHRFTEDDVIIDGRTIYLRMDFLNEIFGLDFTYDPQKLIVRLKTTKDLPVKKYQAIRRRLDAQRELGIPDLPAAEAIFERNPSYTGAGRLLYNLKSEYKYSDIYGTYHLHLGTKVAGGDLRLRLSGIGDPKKYRSPIFRGTYRYPFNDNDFITQVTIGRFYNIGLFPLDMLGAEVTNRPFAPRRLFEREMFDGIMFPDANIELFGAHGKGIIADANSEGKFMIEMPILYGNRSIELHGYDRFGQIKKSSIIMNVPGSLIPPGEVEYSSFFGKLTHKGGEYLFANKIDLGISSKFTVGSQFEYYEIQNIKQKIHLSINATGRILNALIFEGQGSPGAFSKIGFNWVPTQRTDFSLNRKWFSRNNVFNYAKIRNQWEFQARASIIRDKIHLSTNSWHIIYDDYIDTDVSIKVSGTFKQFNPSFYTNVKYRKLTLNDSLAIPTHTSVGSLNMFLPLQVSLRLSLNYNHRDNKLDIFSAGVTKYIMSQLYANFTYSQYPNLKKWFINLNLRYLLPFLEVKGSINKWNSTDPSYGFNVIGSMYFDVPNNSYLLQRSIGTQELGGFIFRPFIDANDNNIMDSGEELIEKGKISIQDKNIGLSPKSLPKNIFTTDRLHPYNEYIVYLDNHSLDDPRYITKYTALSVVSEPYFLKEYDIPIVVGGAVRGAVTLKADDVSNPLEGVTVILTPTKYENALNEKYSIKVSTFSTGEFEFAPVRPGNYKVHIDEKQMDGLGYVSTPLKQDVTVRADKEGHIIDNVNFTIKQR